MPAPSHVLLDALDENRLELGEDALVAGPHDATVCARPDQQVEVLGRARHRRLGCAHGRADAAGLVVELLTPRLPRPPDRVHDPGPRDVRGHQLDGPGDVALDSGKAAPRQKSAFHAHTALGNSWADLGSEIHILKLNPTS